MELPFLGKTTKSCLLWLCSELTYDVGWAEEWVNNRAGPKIGGVEPFIKHKEGGA